jgi:hypothetical protein
VETKKPQLKMKKLATYYTLVIAITGAWAILTMKWSDLDTLSYIQAFAVFRILALFFIILILSFITKKVSLIAFQSVFTGYWISNSMIIYSPKVVEVATLAYAVASVLFVPLIIIVGTPIFRFLDSVWKLEKFRLPSFSMYENAKDEKDRMHLFQTMLFGQMLETTIAKKNQADEYILDKKQSRQYVILCNLLVRGYSRKTLQLFLNILPNSETGKIFIAKFKELTTFFEKQIELETTDAKLHSPDAEAQYTLYGQLGELRNKWVDDNAAFTSQVKERIEKGITAKKLLLGIK